VRQLHCIQSRLAYYNNSAGNNLTESPSPDSNIVSAQIRLTSGGLRTHTRCGPDLGQHCVVVRFLSQQRSICKYSAYAHVCLQDVLSRGLCLEASAVYLMNVFKRSVLHTFSSISILKTFSNAYDRKHLTDTLQVSSRPTSSKSHLPNKTCTSNLRDAGLLVISGIV